MLGHLRSKAFDDFKTKLDQSLNNGEGFASSVRMWSQSIMLEFDKGFDGNNQIRFFFIITYSLSHITAYLIINKQLGRPCLLDSPFAF